MKFLCFCFIFLAFNFSFFIPVFASDDVKASNVAGAFYPSDPKDLDFYVESYVKEGGAPVSGDPVVLIAPHAGYVYSGPVAGHAYAAISGKRYKTVVILAPSHYFPFRGAVVYPEGRFRTPLGDLDVDAVVVRSLTEAAPGVLRSRKEFFEREHALEVHLPFLQTVLSPGFKIVPILVGDLDFDGVNTLAKALAATLDDSGSLVVVSTDLSHYKPYDEACSLDGASIDFIRQKDARGLWDAVAGTGWNVCGVKPVVTGMIYAELKGASEFRMLRYANSGDTAGDRSRVVGYMAGIFLKGDAVAQEGEGAMLLTREDKKRLLEIARATIAASASGKALPNFSEGSPGLNLRRGAFVTLRRHGQLRGCIGLFSSREPLYRVIGQMAVEASAHDYRFSPVTRDELDELTIEISVLSDPARIDDWRKIRLGTDGVIVRKGFQSGVFLPQVATETKWDLETFLGELCSQKAGLPRDCYKEPGIQLLTFQADVFSEEEFR